MYKKSLILCFLIAVAYGVDQSTTDSFVTGTTTIGQTTVTPKQLAAESAHVEDNNGVFSRLVIADKRRDNDNWGLDFKNAEAACQEMTKMIHAVEGQKPTDPEDGELRVIVDKLLGNIIDDRTNKPVNLEGHLIAIHSAPEYQLLGSFFDRLPGDVYWTGGKLIRYTTPSRKSNDKKDSLVLSWTDGTTSNPYELGIDKTRVSELNEGVEYCLAFNTLNGQWQARNCEDRLPYACLLQHSHTEKDALNANDITTLKPSDATTVKPVVAAANDLTSTPMMETTSIKA